MPKQFLDWSDLMAGKVGEPEHPLSRPITPGPTLRKGEVPRRPSDAEIRECIMKGAPKQPTDQEMFGRFEVTEEQAKAAQEQWEGTFTRFFKTNHPPIESQDPNKTWGNRGPVNFNDRSQLTEEERRISEIPVDPSLLSGE
jgi:hypothetical protein